MKTIHYMYAVIAVVLAVAGFYLFRSTQNAVIDKMYVNPSVTASETPAVFTAKPSPIGSVNISMPFTSQAPYGVWDTVHEEACEEASIIMVNAWMKGLPLSQTYAEREIQKIVEWQKNRFGYFESTTAEQTAELAEGFYGLKSRLMVNPTVEELKNELKKGNIIVMGMGGRLLGNPYFTPPGPLYHMLVIKGYDSMGFIVNDPGTRRGADYHYSFSTLMLSARDWSGGKIGTIIKPPVAIIFSK